MSNIRELLSMSLSWIKEAGRPQWRAMHDGEKYELRMNNFPDESLYTLTRRGESVDFDDTPEGWSIPRE